jgi:hypothetical protein
MDPHVLTRANFLVTETGRIFPYLAEKIVKGYKSAIQYRGPQSLSPRGWTNLGGDLWERAEWVTPQLALERFRLSRAAVIRDLKTTEDEFARQVLRAVGAFVPIIDDQRRFVRLVSRSGFLNRVAKQMADEP